ncbi:MAG: PEP-CTERM sorting domain-containing protein [Verrucomicrobiales bacterium]
MKKYTLSALVAAAALTGSASAFNVDFSGYLSHGETLGSKTINVAGYGDIILSAGFGSTLVAGNTYEKFAVESDNAESLVVSFAGASVSGVDFDYVGVNAGENFQAVQIGSNQHLVSLSGSSDGAGVAGVSFASVVPEPSVSLLAFLGGFAFLTRRKR